MPPLATEPEAAASLPFDNAPDLSCAAAAPASVGSMEDPAAVAAEEPANGDKLQPETLNIPAVLWDRPTGSSKRVPPPVPPRSPKRPYDHLSSFAEATASEDEAQRGDRAGFPASSS